MQRKGFVYVYPQKEIIDFEVQNGSFGFSFPGADELNRQFKSAKGKERMKISQIYTDKQKEFFREAYRVTLNTAIDLRYRAKGYNVHFVLLDDGEMSPLVEMQFGDKIVRAGMDSKTHRKKGTDGKYPYPNQDFILNQIGCGKLWVSGFHMWDCVNRLSKRAYQRGAEVMVDEDLTEFIRYNVKDSSFRVESFPGTNPRERFGTPDEWKMFMEPRKAPWFFKDYK